MYIYINNPQLLHFYGVLASHNLIVDHSWS